MRDPFGALLLRQRHDHQLNLRDVAADLGVSVAEVSAWENGRRRPEPGGIRARALKAYRVPQGLHAAFFDLLVLPVLEAPRDPMALACAHVSWAHDESLGDACDCNDCRLAWFNKHACPTCGGDGLRPGAPEKPDDPRVVARFAAIDQLAPPSGEVAGG